MPVPAPRMPPQAASASTPVLHVHRLLRAVPVTDPQTPATEAGRRLIERHADAAVYCGTNDAMLAADIIAIEAEARAKQYERGYAKGLIDSQTYAQGRADALREAAEAVRGLNPEPARGRVYRHAENHMKRRVLVILDPQP